MTVEGYVLIKGPWGFVTCHYTSISFRYTSLNVVTLLIPHPLAQINT